MSTSLDKLNLNNQIVLMRKDIRRARVHIVHKHVREIKLLKQKKGDEDQKEKYLKKIARLEEEIKTIKVLADDVISKFALTNKENPIDILNNVTGKTTEDRVIARFLMSKILTASLTKFKTKYPNWSEEVPALLPTLGKESERQRKSKQKRLFGSQVSEKKKLSKTMTEPLPEETPFNPDSNTVERNLGDVGEDLDKIRNVPKKIKVKSKRSKEDNLEEIKQENTDMEVNHDQDLDNPSTSRPIDKKNRKTKESKVIRIVDPFFVTEDDSAYITLATNEKQVEALQKSTEMPSDFKTNDFSKINEQKKFRAFTRNGTDRRPAAPSRRERRQLMRMNSPSKPSQELEEKLHPSWEAKKKQNSLQITQFAGKKITFDD